MMKIAIINATGGGMSGGYRKYLRNVIPRMAAHYDVESILCATPKSLNVQDWFDSTTNVRFIDCKPFRFLGPRYDHSLLKELEAFSPNVIFVPVERSFQFKKIPVVNLIQNMESFSPNINGNPFSDRFIQWIKFLDGKRAIKRADRIIAPSNYVVEFLKKRLHVPAEKIDLVYYGVRVKNSEQSQRPDVIPQSWSNKFIFTAGSIRPARGLEDIIQALHYLTSKSPGPEKLVIAGSVSGPNISKYQQLLYDLIRKYNLSDKICWTGSLNENEMAWCYQNCQIFVMTSRVESFGMIAVEAMAYGCICISADNPCLPEIFGDAALYYQPNNWKALGESLGNVLAWGDSQLNEASERAKKQAFKFSWDVCAERTVAQFAKVAR